MVPQLCSLSTPVAIIIWAQLQVRKSQKEIVVSLKIKKKHLFSFFYFQPSGFLKWVKLKKTKAIYYVTINHQILISLKKHHIDLIENNL